MPALRLGSFARVVCYDKRGSGVSDPVPLAALPTIEQWADDARTQAGLEALGVSDADIKGYWAYEEVFDDMRKLLRTGARDSWLGASPTRKCATSVQSASNRARSKPLPDTSQSTWGGSCVASRKCPSTSR